ncbi:MAG: CapA family protein [Candidatus Saccharibacteria bacterium]|nr:CapA family protein [Candidatus Saccharibacteria bacterium]
MEEKVKLDMDDSWNAAVDRKPLPVKKNRKKLILALVVAIVLVGFGAAFILHKKPALKTAGKTNNTSKVIADKHANRIRVLMAGDFIAHDSINSQAKQANGTYDYLPMIKDFTPIFSAADIRFCHDANLNGGAAFTIAGYPKFNSPTEFARDMGKVGCNIVATGSNHSFDRNQAAIDASIDAWEQSPNTLAVVGQNHDQAAHDAVNYFSVKGVKFAFLAYTTYLNTDAPAQNGYGVNVFSQDYAAKQIKTAKDNGAKIIITSIRWGTEYSADVSASQKTTAQFLADQGVDLIIGHGSHVLEPAAQLTGAGGKKSLVWYSIGNFLNTQEPAETLFNGLPVVDFDKDTLEITNMQFLPIYQHYEWTAAQAKADDIAARTNIHMYLLENATQAMIDSQQLKTTVQAQKDRIMNTLNSDGLTIPLITSKTYYEE